MDPGLGCRRAHPTHPGYLWHRTASQLGQCQQPRCVLTDPTHPIANEPNQVSLNRFTFFWEGDIGDLVSLTPGSSATILGSANGVNTARDGLITLCCDGRLLLQTFSSHDHAEETMIDAWQNYVYFMLSNRFR